MAVTTRFSWSRLVVAVALAALTPCALAQSRPANSANSSVALYQALARFELNGGSAQAEHLVLVRDRMQMTFSGTFYFEAPLDGNVRGAVFIGKGTVHANAPNSIFEQDNLERMLHAKAVDSDFKTAVLRFSDDTPEALAGCCKTDDFRDEDGVQGKVAGEQGAV